MKNSTIAAIATPPGQGAVALIRISGPAALEVIHKILRFKKSGDLPPRQQVFGEIYDEEDTKLDEVLVTFFRGPHSFTGEDVVEIGTHGGVVVTKCVLDAVLAAGAESAAPGEFSQRAFFNGRIDLTQAEAIMDLISAQTDLAVKAANQQLEGRLGRELEELRQDLIGLIAHVEAYIDFPDEDIDPDSSEGLLKTVREITQKVEKLLATADQGRILREGVRTVICGAPNAGKSSLLNLLLGFDRAIVNESAGTTRDTIEEVINLKGYPIRLVDTAGIREGEGSIEREGIERSRSQIENAELILLVVDSGDSADKVDSINLPENTKTIRILNKNDLDRHPDWEGAEGLTLSCLQSESRDILADAIFEELSRGGGGFDSANLTAINSRHQHCLQTAEAALGQARGMLEACESPEFVAMDLRAALEAIGEVIGKTDVEEILGAIFSTFCIGK